MNWRGVSLANLHVRSLSLTPLQFCYYSRILRLRKFSQHHRTLQFSLAWITEWRFHQCFCSIIWKLYRYKRKGNGLLRENQQEIVLTVLVTEAHEWRRQSNPFSPQIKWQLMEKLLAWCRALYRIAVSSLYIFSRILDDSNARGGGLETWMCKACGGSRRGIWARKTTSNQQQPQELKK